MYGFFTLADLAKNLLWLSRARGVTFTDEEAEALLLMACIYSTTPEYFFGEEKR